MKSRIIGLIGIVFLLLVAGCSTTKNLPEGEELYTGCKISIGDSPSAPNKNSALTDVNAALFKAPSTKLFGYLPIPFGMWMYNDFVKYEHGFGRWMFNHFAVDPVFISTVNPGVRTKVATNVLHDYGYFNAKVSSNIVNDSKNAKKARVEYTVEMNNPSYVDTLMYENFSPASFAHLKRTRKRALVNPGDQFTVADLDAERTRISNLLRNNGCYYFRSDYMRYLADTTLVKGGHVSLKLQLMPGLPKNVEKPYYIGKRDVFFIGRNNEQPTDSISFQDMVIHYKDKLPLRPKVLNRWLHYQSNQKNDSLRNLPKNKLYSLRRQNRIQEKLASTGVFSYMDFRYVPRDTTAQCDTLDMILNATMDKTLDAELALNVTSKSNDQMGPGASFSVTKNNIFGGGETFGVKLKGSYEWQTGNESGNSALNSWELGASSSLTFPRVVFPTLGAREYDYPATTTFKIYADLLNRAKYYQLLSFGGNATYDFQPTTYSKHSITPFRLTFNVLRNPTEAFIEAVVKNPALFISLDNQFIPAMEYTYTFDNTKVRRVANPKWWQTTITSAGNLTSCIYKVFGRSFNEKNKDLFGAPFAQFVKVNSEFRFLWNIDQNNAVATRVSGGLLWAYGNEDVAPYSEQFYVGGANSIRAFTIRSIGPGGTAPIQGMYGFLDQTGTIRLEANVEYRFHIFSDLHGAVFLDAGNVWLMKEDENRPDANFRLSKFAKQIALGTGFGLRYDMQYLVFRLDFGVPLHDPYDTGKSGYYNITGSFWKQLGIHFAIGYPF